MRKTFSLIAVLGLFAAGQATAQSVTGSASIRIEPVLTISASNTAISFSTPTDVEYNAGYVSGTPVTLTTSGNVQHKITIAATSFATGGYMNATNLTTSTTAAWVQKPIGDLQWCQGTCSGDTGFLGLSATAADVRTAIGPGRDRSTTVNYLMRLNWADDKPGDYQVGVTYSVVAN